jgi:hypothetical protein
MVSTWKIQMIVFYISNDQSKNQILQITQILVSKYFKYIQMAATPQWFLPTIHELLNIKLDTPVHPPLIFKLSQDAAIHNMNVLRAHGDSIQNLIKACQESFISPGSEFRPVALLEKLFMHHHNWPMIQASMTRGSTWPLTPSTKEDRVAKNIEFIAQGNHKLAIKYEREYIKIVESEVAQGWMFPIPLHYINVLKHGELAPVGVDDKVWSDLPDGSKKVKYRLTHDQSFEATKGVSVNGRVIKEKLPPLFYGGCLSRLLHYIVDIRSRHPSVPILGAKSDFKAAYCRVSLHGDVAKKSAIMCNEFAIPSLRLTFGGSPCPNEFCLYSELSADLANDLLHCPDWNPTELGSPHAASLPEPNYQQKQFHLPKPGHWI